MIPFHPLADIFPLIEGPELADLIEDIRANGVRDPIVLYEDAILDGRNRYRALVALRERGLPRGNGWGGYAGEPVTDEDLAPTAGLPWFERFSAGLMGDALAYVISKNLKRRHLNESQRAMVAARLASMRQGERTDLEPSANLPKVAQPEAAARLQVSDRLLRSAKLVQEQGTPQLRHAVEQGKLAVSAAAEAARLAPEIQRAIAAEAETGRANVVRTVIKQQSRAQRERALGAHQHALPTKKYGVIVADPEWRFEPWSRQSGLARAADNHYPTAPTAVIAARAVAAIAADDCVLYLWATAPMLPQALAVMAAWGFDYRAHQIWYKDRVGTGYWFRSCHELLLVGTKGNIPAPAAGTEPPSVVTPPAGAHSAKPECFLAQIEFYFPQLPKIELNRRGPPRPGWDAWGNEALPPPTEIQQPGAAVSLHGGAAAPAPLPSLAGAGAPGPAAGDGLELPDFLDRQSPDCSARRQP